MTLSTKLDFCQMYAKYDVMTKYDVIVGSNFSRTWILWYLSISDHTLAFSKRWRRYYVK